MRSTYPSSRVVPLPSIPENEFLITPEHESVELDSQSSIMKYSIIDSSSLPEWESSVGDEPRSKWTMVCGVLRGPFYMFLGMITVATLCSIAWDNILTCISEGRNIGLIPGHRPSLFSSWLARGVNPVFCHSHNDYWRDVPLYSALTARCSSVEADICLDGEDLRVGHTSSTLLKGQTLRSLYLDPLLEILDQHNPLPNASYVLETRHEQEFVGVFANDPKQTLVLLIDFKTEGEQIWIELMEQLKPLRERGFLSYFNGSDRVVRSITVVATGDAAFHRIVANVIFRDIFYDAPLDEITYESDFDFPIEGSRDEPEELVYNVGNSYYASVDFRKAIGPLPLNWLTQDQLARLQSQIDVAHARGLKVRYWGTPNQPIGLREYVWRTLVHQGVDVLNVDDLHAATKGDWNSQRWWNSAA